MAVYEGWRNQHTTLDAAKAKNRLARKCDRCGTGVDGNKKFCRPCSADRYDETVAANRVKYKNARRG